MGDNKTIVFLGENPRCSLLLHPKVTWIECNLCSLEPAYTGITHEGVINFAGQRAAKDCLYAADLLGDKRIRKRRTVSRVDH